MRKFLLPMPDMYIGEIEEWPIRNANKEIIGSRTVIKLEYRGGFVKVDVDKAFADTLKTDMQGTATVQMEPAMSGATTKNGFGYIQTGFEGFKLIGFEPKK